MSWIKNYEPKSINDFIGNKELIDKIIAWLDSFYSNTLDSNDSGSIIISGSHGVGKSLCVKLILNCFDCNYKFLDSNQPKNQDTFEDYKKYVHNKGTIYNIMQGKKIKKFALIIDDSENISLNREKNAILTLHKENIKKRYFPIIFITSNQHSKMISDIKKKYNNEYQLAEPNGKELSNFVRKISKIEKINFTQDMIEQMIEQIVSFSQSDVRRLLNILNDLSLTFKSKIITPSLLQSFFENTQVKNVDIGLFEATRMTMNSFHSIDNTLNIYEVEKVLLPLMIFENYKNKIFSKENGNLEEILQKAKIISDNISMGDIIETNIYTDQNWYLQNIHGFYTCCVPAFHMNHDVHMTNDYEVNFSSDLNKTSSRNINKKNFNILKNSVLNLSSFDILFINKIFYNLALNEDYETITKLMRKYNIDLKNLEILIKIDKTVDTKIQFTAKIRKIIQKYLQ